MNDNITSILIKKWKGIDLSMEENALYNNWITEEGNSDLEKNYSRVWELTGKLEVSTFPQLNIDDEWETFTINKNAIKKVYKLNFKLIAYAASVVLIIVLSALFYLLSPEKIITLQTFGENKTIELPDGSSVILNRNSQLSYSKNFGTKHRQLQMTGEAYFEVKKDSLLPFEITTAQNVVTLVLGTRFNLRHYANEPRVILSVISGKVAFGEKGNTTLSTFTQNQSASFSIEQHKLIIQEENAGNSIGWHTGIFDFNGSSILEVKKYFEEYFNIEIILPHNIQNMSFTGYFKQPSLDEAIETIALAMGWQYAKKGNVVEFRLTENE